METLKKSLKKMCIRDRPTRIGYKLTKEVKDGKEVVVKQRIAKKTGEVID